MPESIHNKLSRVRAPRVHITYEVETGGAIQMRELPFVMGVLGDFTGHPTEPLPKLKERKFVEINPDNFDDVLKSMRPHLSFTVANRLSDGPDAGKIGVDLSFQSMDDFSPERVAEQVPALRKLLERRQRLADLRASIQGNDKLNEKLEEVLQATLEDPDMKSRLQNELAPEGAPDVQE